MMWEPVVQGRISGIGHPGTRYPEFRGQRGDGLEVLCGGKGAGLPLEAPSLTYPWLFLGFCWWLHHPRLRHLLPAEEAAAETDRPMEFRKMLLAWPLLLAWGTALPSREGWKAYKKRFRPPDGRVVDSSGADQPLRRPGIRPADGGPAGRSQSFFFILELDRDNLRMRKGDSSTPGSGASGPTDSGRSWITTTPRRRHPHRLGSC